MSRRRPWSDPFTVEEVYRAYRLVAPDPAARELVARLERSAAEGRAAHLTDDVLLLLSLLSPELDRRVHDYVVPRLDAEERELWMARRRLLVEQLGERLGSGGGGAGGAGPDGGRQLAPSPD